MAEPDSCRFAWGRMLSMTAPCYGHAQVNAAHFGCLLVLGNASSEVDSCAPSDMSAEPCQGPPPGLCIYSCTAPQPVHLPEVHASEADPSAQVTVCPAPQRPQRPHQPEAPAGAGRCQRLPCREATAAEVAACHDPGLEQHLAQVSQQAAALAAGPHEAAEQVARGSPPEAAEQGGGAAAACVHLTPDTFANRHTSLCARLAAGASIDVAVAVAR